MYDKQPKHIKKKGDFCRVIKSKYLAPGTIVEVLDELQEGTPLCGSPQGNTIVVSKNLQLDGEAC